MNHVKSFLDFWTYIKLRMKIILFYFRGYQCQMKLNWLGQETWLAFIRRWLSFNISLNISSQNSSIQLFQCEHDKLDDLMLANDPRLMVKSEEAKLMESVAVIKIAGGIKRAELVSLHQPRWTFKNICNRSEAENCNFSDCECGKKDVTYRRSN